MKKILLGLFIAFSLSACSINSDEENYNCGSTANVAFTNFPLDCNYSIKTLPIYPTAIVINSQEKLETYFTKHESTCPNPTNATIDFSKYYLVSLFAGPKATSGYSIKVISVVENNCEMVIDFYEKAPLPGEVVTQAISYPSDFILIPKTTKPIYYNKVNQMPNSVVIGSFRGECTGNDCQQFYQINDYNVLHFLNVVSGNYDFSQYSYEGLTPKGDYTLFLKNVPAEILNLKGQTKTYGSPDSHDQGGLYFELRQGADITKIYLDNDNTADQNSEILLFKKAIQDKITALKTN